MLAVITKTAYHRHRNEKSIIAHDIRSTINNILPSATSPIHRRWSFCFAAQKREIACVLLWQKRRDEGRTQDLSFFTVVSLSLSHQMSGR